MYLGSERMSERNRKKIDGERRQKSETKETERNETEMREVRPKKKKEGKTQNEIKEIKNENVYKLMSKLVECKKKKKKMCTCDWRFHAGRKSVFLV